MQQFLSEGEPGNITDYLEQEVVRDLKREYGDILYEPDMGLAPALREIFAETGRQFIFLIDEWDCVRDRSQKICRDSTLIF